jgi:hypothetical protein
MAKSMPETLPQIRSRPGLASMFAQHRFLLLFLFLLATLIAYPYAEKSGAGYYVFRLLGSAIIVLSVYVVSFRRGVATITILLAIPALVQHLLHPRADASILSLINLILSFAFDIWIVVAIFRRVFAHVQITSETIFGALCIYLLNGLTFSSVYGLVATLQTGAFLLDPLTNRHSVPDRFDLIYYSFGTMTQLGVAGITAVSDQARSLSVMEAILGQLYLAVLISRLVGAYRTIPAAERP